MPNPPRQSASHNHRAPRAVGCCIGAPFLIALGLFLVYSYNNRLPDIPVPAHLIPANNGWKYLHQAYGLSQKMKHKTPYDMNREDDTFANFQNCARDAEPTLLRIREALNHPFVCPRIIGSTDLPQVQQTRDLSRIIAGAADFYDLSNDPGESMELRLTGLEMGVDIERGGSIVPELVGFSCEANAIPRFEPLLPRLDSAELKRAADHIDRIKALRAAFSEIVREDGYTNTAEMLARLNNPHQPSLFTAAFAALNPNESDPDLSRSARVTAAMDAIKQAYRNKRVMLEDTATWFAAVAKEVDEPYSGHVLTRAPDSISDIVSPSAIETLWARHVAMEAQVDVLSAEIALYRYKMIHDVFPQALSDLCPQFLPVVPIDPCSGSARAPLRYSITGDGSFLLYSIGPDMLDDSGVPAKRVGEMGGDIVAGKLHKYGPILYPGAAK